jgi:hypothetical protein
MAKLEWTAAKMVAKAGSAPGRAAAIGRGFELSAGILSPALSRVKMKELASRIGSISLNRLSRIALGLDILV